MSETIYDLSVLDITAELVALGLTDMSNVSDWSFGMFDDYGNTIDLYPTPQSNMWLLVWTDVMGMTEENGLNLKPNVSILATKKGDATRFVEWIRANHPS